MLVLALPDPKSTLIHFVPESSHLLPELSVPSKRLAQVPPLALQLTPAGNPELFPVSSVWVAGIVSVVLILAFPVAVIVLAPS